MKIGLHFQLSSSGRPSSRARRYDQMFSLVAHAQDNAYDGVWIADRHSSDDGCVPNPLMLLARASDIAPSMRLGVADLALSHWHPIRLARDVATLDVMSAGRVDLGIEHAWHEGDVPSDGGEASVDLAELDESLMIMRGAFAEDGFSCDDRFWQVSRAAEGPRPSTRPRPPIWMATTSRDSIRAAVTRGLHVCAGPEALPGELARRTAFIDSVARDVGIPVEQIERATTRFVFCSDDPREIREAVACARRHVRASRGLARRGQPGARPEVATDLRGEPDDDIWQRRMIVGDPEECIRRLRELAGAGISYVRGQFDFGEINPGMARRSVERFSSDVMPATTELPTRFTDQH